MGGNSRPGSALGSWMSVFSDDQEERGIPIVEQQDSRMKHLAVKAEEWNEPGVREGIYTASLMYIKSNGNDSSGSKLNSVETVKKELGKVTGDEAGYLWKSVDVKEWYRAMKQKIFRCAFVSPFDAMGMLMVENGEKNRGFRSDQERQGRKMYATLNITKEAAQEQIEYHVRKNERGEEELLEHYASRLTVPTFAYLRGDGFKGGISGKWTDQWV